MTGFGRAEHATEALVARVEISSINRKQGEVIIQLPRTYAELEANLRKYTLTKISRGRLNVSITLEIASDSAKTLTLDSAKALALKNEMVRISAELKTSLTITTADILRIPDIMQQQDSGVDADTALSAIQPALEQALANLITMRSREGDDLKQDSIDRLTILEQETTEIEAHAPSVILRYKENLHRRLNESGLDIDLDDERVLKEIGLFAEKCDISEEITRLRSHFAKFREYLDSNKPVGRSLDFLCQEINREFNTIGSKANDATLAQHVVHSKTELEKMREQIQNVE